MGFETGGTHAELEDRQLRTQRFVARIYRSRVIGVTLAFFPIGLMFWQNGTSPWLWGLLVAYCSLWPHIAYAIGRNSANPAAMEFRWILLDSALGGVWIAAMHFNPLPSFAVALMLALDTVVVGGWRLFLRGVALQAVVCLLVSAALGFPFDPVSTQIAIFITLPILMCYMLAAGFETHRLARQSRRQERSLLALSQVDPATGLLNHSSLQAEITSEWARLAEHGGSSTLMMLDIDEFKRINDSYGHQVGDRAILSLVAMIRQVTRHGDRVGRYGGDEFAVLLVGTDIVSAKAVAERIRGMVAGYCFDETPRLRLSVSIGLADNRVAQDVQDWLGCADAALYRAKAEGRNRVVLAMN